MQLIQFFLVPVCFGMAWAIVLVLIWSIWTAIRDGVSKAKEMHQIPCAHCRFFTGNYHLKCPVHPTIALSNDAINCRDYEAITYATPANSDSAYPLGRGMR